MTGIDAAGTCHLVGCPGKGQHPPHGIGTPDDFTPYQQPATAASHLTADRDLLVRCDSLLSALVHGRVAPKHYIQPADLEEAALLSARLRAMTGSRRG